MALVGDPLAAAGVREGDILAGKYRVERILGVGGMGAVVAAHHLRLDAKVAIKFLLPQTLTNPDAVRRFANEARRAIQIKSEHVARVQDVDTLENGAPYMVMEHLQGSDLSAILAQRGSLALEEAVDFVLQAMEAVAEAHALGIVHRDLKPANLFCVRSADGKPLIKVLDFGISKGAVAGGASGQPVMAPTMTMIGSPFYMSPEQMDSPQSVDARADIWAFGVILFELTTGKLPFFGETLPEVWRRIETRPAPRLREFRLDAPEGLEAVILTCLEKDRERRYRNVAELALALLPFAPKRSKPSVEKIADILRAAGLSTTAVSVPESPDRGSPPQRGQTLPDMTRTTNGGKRGKAVGTLMGGAGVLVAAGVAVLIGRVLPLGDRGKDGGTAGTGALVEAGGVHEAVQASAPQVCEPGSTRCSGAARETCDGKGWIRGPVTEGTCGAVCTPESSGPRCRGTTVLRCNAGGQWADGVVCNGAQVCQNGACVAVPIPPPPRHDADPPRPKLDCDPPYTIDPKTGAHKFKPWCV